MNKTVWITKYALTTGITKLEVEKCFSPNVIRDIAAMYTGYYHKPEWHDTLDEAKVRAEEMRQKKIISLKKALSKLKQLKF